MGDSNNGSLDRADLLAGLQGGTEAPGGHSARVVGLLKDGGRETMMKPSEVVASVFHKLASTDGVKSVKGYHCGIDIKDSELTDE